MTGVQVTCPRCHDVKVPIGVIAILEFGSILSYSFPCPECGDLIEKACTQPIARQLIDAGAWWTHENSVRESPQEKWIRQVINRIEHPSGGAS